MLSTLKQHRYFLFPFLWAGVIFIGSSVPGSALPSAPSGTTMIVHFFEYSALSVFLVWAFVRSSSSTSVLRFVWNIIVIGVLYAISDELHQLFVPYRHFDIIDLFIDVLGIVFGLVLSRYVFFPRFFIQRKK